MPPASVLPGRCQFSLIHVFISLKVANLQGKIICPALLIQIPYESFTPKSGSSLGGMTNGQVVDPYIFEFDPRTDTPLVTLQTGEVEARKSANNNPRDAVLARQGGQNDVGLKVEWHTTRPPVFASKSSMQSFFKYSHRKSRISDIRQPVSSRSRNVAIVACPMLT